MTDNRNNALAVFGESVERMRSELAISVGLVRSVIPEGPELAQVFDAYQHAYAGLWALGVAAQRADAPAQDRRVVTAATAHGVSMLSHEVVADSTLIWRASCSCGWRSSWYPEHTPAFNVGRKHTSAMAQLTGANL